MGKSGKLYRQDPGQTYINAMTFRFLTAEFIS